MKKLIRNIYNLLSISTPYFIIFNYIKNYFPNIKINLLCAKSNANLLINQIHQYKPRYVYIHDKKKSKIN